MSDPVLGLHYSPFELEEVDLYVDRDDFIGDDVTLISESYGDEPDQIDGQITSGSVESAHEFGWNFSGDEIEIVLTDEGVEKVEHLLSSDQDFLSSRAGTKGYKINFYDARDPEGLDPSSPYHFLTAYRDKGVGETLEDKINNIFREES